MAHPGRLRKLVVPVLRLLAVFAVSALLLEVFFRWALFGEDRLALALGRRLPVLREPQSYAHTRSAAYWKLAHLTTDEQYRGSEARYDPVLGWHSRLFEPGSYAHADEAAVGARRPVLLFGDSFAKCVTGQELCWEGLLERSELAGEFALLNYGVDGFGLDQISLACRLVLPRFLDREPVVVVCVLLDDDIDRSILDFRGRPKPRCGLTEERSVEWSSEPVPPSRADYLRQHGVGIRSYAWGFLTHATPLLPWARRAALREHDADVRRLGRALLEELVATLEAAEVAYFFVGFHGPTFGQESSRVRRREIFFTQTLDRVGAPYVLSRVPLERHAAQSGVSWDAYFYTEGGKRNHYTPLGNEVVFQAIRDGLRGEFPPR